MNSLKLTASQINAINELAIRNGWVANLNFLRNGVIALQVRGEFAARILYRHFEPSPRRRVELRLASYRPIAAELIAIIGS